VIREGLIRISWALLARLGVALVLFSAAAHSTGSSGAIRRATPAAAAVPGWTLVWSDEFDGPNGSRPDAAKWVYDIGGDGWGNQELEYYTYHQQNAFLEDGRLVIRAIREDFTGTDGVARHFTSARLKTQGKFSQTYGRFEARIKIPQGQGIWPAFWMLGADVDKAGWPACGEIDIMENIGKEPSQIHGSMHGPGYSGDRGFTSIFKLPGGGRFEKDFHVYAVEWEPSEVRFYMDSRLYATFTPDLLPPGMKWVFDHPFFILLNVAVGGDWPGPPDANTAFPQSMLVDYVRVYTKPSK
jgi:beta-glucanase (GH16 family)